MNISSGEFSEGKLPDNVERLEDQTAPDTVTSVSQQSSILNGSLSDSESSEQTSSTFDARSPPSSAATSVPPRGEEWDRTLRHTSLRDFGTSLNKAAKAVFPNDKKSRYSQVYVLLVSWQTQDPALPVEREISALRQVLEHDYHYDIEEFQIPDINSHAEVSEKVNTFVKIGKNSSSDLKIVYYAGHSRLSRTKELLWSTLPEKTSSKCPIVMWSGIQRSLEMANSDVLILLDSCSSGVANASEGNGVTELICACPFDSKANGVGHYSFTKALTTELRFLKTKPCFSVGELYTSVYTRMQSFLPQGIENERYPPPVHFVLTHDEPFIRGIKLSVHDSRDTENNQTEGGRFKRVHFQEECNEKQSREKESPDAPNKRLCLNETYDSRMEAIVRPWIEGSGPQAPQNPTDSPATLGNSQEDSTYQTMTDQTPSTKSSEECRGRLVPRDSMYPLDAPRALFLVRFSEDIKGEDLNEDLFKEWLRSAPAAVEEVRIEAGFKCFSTLLLVTIPLAMCSYMPQHPAIYPLGPIKSSIMLPSKNLVERPSQNKDRRMTSASMTGVDGKRKRVSFTSPERGCISMAKVPSLNEYNSSIKEASSGLKQDDEQRAYGSDKFSSRQRPNDSRNGGSSNTERFFKDSGDTIIPVPVQRIQKIIIGDEEEVTRFYKYQFKDMQQSACKIMGKAFVELVEPKRQTHHLLPKENDKAPPWWPSTACENHVRYKETDDLLQPERIRLLVHILKMIIEPREKQSTTIQKLGLNVKKLEEATMEAISNWFSDKDHPENANKRPFLNGIFKIARAHERYKKGEIDDTTVISVMYDDMAAVTDASRTETTANAETQEAPTFKVSEPAKIYVRNIFDKFPMADPELVQRLGESNWQRHVRIRNHNEVSSMINFTAAGTKSVFHDSALGSSMPSMPSNPCYDPSIASLMTKAGDADSEYFKVPPTPKEVVQGKSFICFICGHLKTRIKNRIDWKMHVFRDIRPYICTVSTCKDALCTFACRAEWADHQFSHHCHQSQVLVGGSVQQSFTTKQDESSSISTPIPRSMDVSTCPLCRIDLGSAKKKYVSHVAKHMESIALATLPPGPDENSDDDSDDSVHAATDQWDVTSEDRRLYLHKVDSPPPDERLQSTDASHRLLPVPLSKRRQSGLETFTDSTPEPWEPFPQPYGRPPSSKSELPGSETFTNSARGILPKSSNGFTWPPMEPFPTPVPKKRGRPSKADIERKQQEETERGDVWLPSNSSPLLMDSASASGSGLTLMDWSVVSVRKKRGRPSKADLERKRQESVARGYTVPPSNASKLPMDSTSSKLPKKRGRPSKKDMERNQQELIAREYVVPPSNASQLPNQEEFPRLPAPNPALVGR